MADFKTAFQRTSAFEGGYVNDSNDNGGETYRGISRKFNPNWKGWKIVDSLKKKTNFPKSLDSNNELQNLVLDCYKTNYWDKVWGDKINHQKVANDMYDVAVNCGVSMSIKLSERQFGFKETGVMSEKLLNKLNSVI